MGNRLTFSLVSLVLLALTTACATAPESRDARLKRFEAMGEVASLYVYRSEALGPGDRMEVVLDGKPLGRTGAKTYLHSAIAPGTHKLVSKAENVEVLEFEAMAGKLYFARQEVRLGIFGSRSRLAIVNGEEGRRGVLECSLAGE